MTRVLINGISGTLGAQIAQIVSAQPDMTVIGLGRKRPPGPIGTAEWLTAKLSGRQLIELLRAEQIDTVIHLDFAGVEEHAPNREAAVQQNVLGSMELFGACINAGVRRVVMRSHIGVYGATPTNPTFISESYPVARSGLSGIVRDFAEVELFLADFAPQHPELVICTLRCAPMVGAWSPFVHYLSQEGPQMVFGFDPSMQMLHVEDAAIAFAKAVCAPAAGPLNLAADDTLRLSQAIRMAGQQPVSIFEPLAGLAALWGDRSALSHWPFDVSFLRHSIIADTGRAKTKLGWSPAHSAADALQALRQNGNAAEDRAASEQALRKFLGRKSDTGW